MKKILEICNFSSGVSGVWSRVFEEAKRLVGKYEVHVFSSDIENGQINQIKEETIEGVRIKRFRVKSRLGYALFFDFEKEAMKLRPDIIIAHGFRKPYLGRVIKLAKKMKIKSILVTHAPFVEKELRSSGLNLIVSLYDIIYARKILNSFDKVLAITDWEIPHLSKLGLEKKKIDIVPNGIPDEFFSFKKREEKKGKILFFGRVDPIKNIETLLKALSSFEGKYELEIAGPGDKDYIMSLKELADNLGIRAKFTGPIYDIKDKIRKIDSAEIFILPSKREAMPISLIEAMSREKIVISSDSEGGKEIIEDGKNGLLFRRGDSDNLREKIELCFEDKSRIKRIRANAKKSVNKYRWSKIIIKINSVLDKN